MIVWLWDADGPARTARGVTGDEAAARHAAEACLRNGQARSAAVEQAHAVLGMESLTTGYQRTGNGWTAKCCHDGRISWMRFAGSPELAAL